MRVFILLIALLTSSLSFSQNDYLLAEDYFRKGAYQKAATLYKKLVESNRFNTTYLKRLVTCYQEIDAFGEAETLLNDFLKQRPDQYYINVELGYNYERQEQPEKAKVYYDKAIADIATRPTLGGVVGRLFRNNNTLDYAVKAYELSMQLNPNANYSYQVAQIYGEQGDFQSMFQAYVDLIDKDENYLSSVKRFTSNYLSDDANDPNNILFKRTLLKKAASRPKNIWNELLSWLFTTQGEYSKALAQEKALFRRNPEYLSNSADLGKIAFDNLDYEASKACFEFVFANSSFIEEQLFAQLYLIKTAIKTNDPKVENLFNVVFERYGKTPATLDIQVTYADYLTFQKNTPEHAKSILEEALALSGSKFEKARIKLKLADVLVYTNQFNKALLYVSQVQTQLKNHPLGQEARFKVAQTSYFKGDFNWAMTQLKVLKSSTTQLIANDALELFLVISENIPNDSIPTGLKAFAKAEVLSYQNQTEAAIVVYDSILSKHKGKDIEDDALFKQAKLFSKVGAFDKAIQNLVRLSTTLPESVFIDDAYFTLAELYELKLNDVENASKYYQKIIFEQPSSYYLVAARKRYRLLRGDQIN